MRYKCVGSPMCMKTFEYGHALRAHIASCDLAQKTLREKASVEKLEYDVGINYSGINGLHRNPYYPTAHHLDKTFKFQFADKDKFATSTTTAKTETATKSDDVSAASVTTASTSKTAMIRRLRNRSESNIHSSTQVKKLLAYQQEKISSS